jgi:hypothetical protein
VGGPEETAQRVGTMMPAAAFATKIVQCTNLLEIAIKAEYIALCIAIRRRKAAAPGRKTLAME